MTRSTDYSLPIVYDNVVMARPTLEELRIRNKRLPKAQRKPLGPISKLPLMAEPPLLRRVHALIGTRLVQMVDELPDVPLERIPIRTSEALGPGIIVLRNHQDTVQIIIQREAPNGQG